MKNSLKPLHEILEKFNIEKLTPMQIEAGEVIRSRSNVILLSPTGTGKTLAYLLPLLEEIDPDLAEVQLLIIVPSRELAIQIEQVIRQMGTGLKVNAVYGGRQGSLDKIDIKHRPAILVGTPGRVADHLRRNNFATAHLTTLVLDEFDKSLEVGFEKEMQEISEMLHEIRKRILTSATRKVNIPKFLGFKSPAYVDYQEEGESKLVVRTILSSEKDKLNALHEVLGKLGDVPGIVFCSFKDSIARVSEFLTQQGIEHGCFHGGMEQVDRERTLIKFRNGSFRLLLATDLAARGIDIPEIQYIIHYHLPLLEKEFTHRNGRTARMNSEGAAYILLWEQEEPPVYAQELNSETLHTYELRPIATEALPNRKTLYITGGRKDKISKGDIAGMLIKQGGLSSEEVGVIEIKQDCAFVGVDAAKADEVIAKVNNLKLKTKKVRVSII